MRTPPQLRRGKTVLIMKDYKRVCVCVSTLCRKGVEVLSEDVCWASELKKSCVTMFFQVVILHLLPPHSHCDLV